MPMAFFQKKFLLMNISIIETNLSVYEGDVRGYA
jgi:hypothetical protein